MDDDDKFWKIPEGRSWAEAGPILRSLSAKPAKPVRRRRRTEAQPSLQQRLEQFERNAAFYRRIGQDFEAEYWDRQAAKVRATLAGQAVRHG